MHGFDVGEASLLKPPVEIEDVTRARLVRVMAAVASGATPEEVTGFLEDGFPDEVEEQLGRPLETEEMSAHVDVFLAALQSAPATASA